MVSISSVSVPDAAPPALRASGSLFSRLLTSGQVQKIYGQVAWIEVWAADVKRKQLPSCSCSSSEHAELITNVIKEASPLRRVIQRIVRCLFGDRMIFSGAALEAAMARAVTEQLTTTNEDIHNRANLQSEQHGKQATRKTERIKPFIEQHIENQQSGSDCCNYNTWAKAEEVKYSQVGSAGYAAMCGDKCVPVKLCGDNMPPPFSAHTLCRWMMEPDKEIVKTREWQLDNRVLPKNGNLQHFPRLYRDLRETMELEVTEEYAGRVLEELRDKVQEDPEYSKWLEEEVFPSFRLSLEHADQMEDRCIVDACTLSGQEAKIFGILDGHGGHEVVDYVRQRFVATFAEHFQKALPQAGEHTSNAEGREPLIVQHALKATCQQLHNEILKSGMQDGTTLTLAVCLGNRIYSANIGDSRQVLLQPDKKYQQLTVDQGLPVGSAEKPVEDERKELAQDPCIGKYIRQIGKFKPVEQQQSSLKRSAAGGWRLGSINMCRSLGDGLIRGKKHTPEVSWVDRGEADYLVLACDGVWDVLTSEEVSAAIRDLQEKQPGIKEAEIAMRITELAYARGSGDNLSMLVVRLSGDGEISTPSQEPYGGLQWVSETAAQSTDEGAGEKHTDAPDVAIARRQAVLAARERAHEMLSSSFVPDFAKEEMSRRVRAELRERRNP